MENITLSIPKWKTCTPLLSFNNYDCRIVLTSKTGNKKRELAEKLVLNPRARLPIAWIASTATAIFTSVISCEKKTNGLALET